MGDVGPSLIIPHNPSLLLLSLGTLRDTGGMRVPTNSYNASSAAAGAAARFRAQDLAARLAAEV